MFVRCKRRFKDGKEHRYWSVVENVRVRGGRVVQRHVLYLGEINDSQRAAWCRSIEVLEGKSRSRQMALFPEDREAPALGCEVVRIAVKDVELRDPRQWGACWLALVLWDRLDLDRFWGPRLPPSRQGTRWLDVLKIQVCYRLIDPGSEWRLHRHWYEHSALRDLLGCDRAIADDALYRCLDKLLAHKQAFFSYLRARWAALFDARFDVLLYDLTSTYFESDLAGRPSPSTRSRTPATSRHTRPRSRVRSRESLAGPSSPAASSCPRSNGPGRCRQTEASSRFPAPERFRAPPACTAARRVEGRRRQGDGRTTGGRSRRAAFPHFRSPT